MLTNDAASYRETAEAIAEDISSWDIWDELDDQDREELIERWTNILMERL